MFIEAFIGDNWVARSYTLTSTELNNYYEISVKREKFGLFSNWLFDHCKIGSVMRTSIPQGNFLIDCSKQSPVVCFVAGIGVTPAIAFVRNIFSLKKVRPLIIYYSAHDDKDVLFRDELLNYQNELSSIKINIRITRTEGRMNEDEVAHVASQHPDADFYICGPANYLEFVSHALQRTSLPMNRIFIEEFTPAGSKISSS